MVKKREMSWKNVVMWIGILACSLAISACQERIDLPELPLSSVSGASPLSRAAATPGALVQSATRTADPTRLPDMSVPNVPFANQVGPCFAGGCHSDLKTKEELFKHQPYVDSRCLDCHKGFHTPATEQKRLFMELDLCYSCHTRAVLGNSHPVGEGVIDPNTRKTMTCTSTCHRSHTAPYRYLLTLSGKGALCVACHKEFL